MSMNLEDEFEGVLYDEVDLNFSSNLLTGFDDILFYFLKISRNEVIIDTNLFILILIGATNPDYIGQITRTDMFTKNDYHRLIEILRPFNSAIILPNVVTEICGIIGKDLKRNQKFKKDFLLKLKEILASDFFKEECINIQELTNESYFYYLDLADSAIIKISKRRLSVISKDDYLCKELEKHRIPVLNFTQFMDHPNR